MAKRKPPKVVWIAWDAEDGEMMWEVFRTKKQAHRCRQAERRRFGGDWRLLRATVEEVKP